VRVPCAGSPHCLQWTFVALRTADAFALEPRLQCLVLRDAAEPGFPSFCVLSAAHLTRFGDHLLPPGVFVNQDADPFLFELYRCCPGAVAALSTVTVTNKRGESPLLAIWLLRSAWCSACSARYAQETVVQHASSQAFMPTAHTGGIQCAGAMFDPPLYERRHASQASFRAALASWRARLPAEMRQDGLTVDVLIPSLRADPSVSGQVWPSST
jgi:hypothetical protein